MDKEAILPLYGPNHSQQQYQSCLLWFKMITLTNQTAIVAGFNMRREGCLDLIPQYEEDKPHPRAKYEDLTLDTTDAGSRSVREFDALCVLPKTKKQKQNISVANAT